MSSNLPPVQERKESGWAGEWDLAMERRLAGAPKARRPGPEEGRRLVLREGRCLSNDAFPNGGFITHFGKNLRSSMWEI
jgi:hypothetical protein